MPSRTLRKLFYAAGVRCEEQNDRVICDCCNKPVAVVRATSDNHFICEGCEEDLQSFYDGNIGSLTQRCFRCKTLNLLDTWHQCQHDGGSCSQSRDPEALSHRMCSSGNHLGWKTLLCQLKHDLIDLCASRSQEDDPDTPALVRYPTVS